MGEWAVLSLELPTRIPYTDRMKNKNNGKNTKIETLKERYKVGDVLKVIESFQDGRGGTDNVTHYITITKVNRVSVEGAEGEAVMILDLQDLFHAKKVIQREILA